MMIWIFHSWLLCSVSCAHSQLKNPQTLLFINTANCNVCAHHWCSSTVESNTAACGWPHCWPRCWLTGRWSAAAPIRSHIKLSLIALSAWSNRQWCYINKHSVMHMQVCNMLLHVRCDLEALSAVHLGKCQPSTSRMNKKHTMGKCQLSKLRMHKKHIMVINLGTHSVCRRTTKICCSVILTWKLASWIHTDHAQMRRSQNSMGATCWSWKIAYAHKRLQAPHPAQQMPCPTCAREEAASSTSDRCTWVSGPPALWMAFTHV